VAQRRGVRGESNLHRGTRFPGAASRRRISFAPFRKFCESREPLKAKSNWRLIAALAFRARRTQIQTAFEHDAPRTERRGVSDHRRGQSAAIGPDASEERSAWQAGQRAGSQEPMQVAQPARRSAGDQPATAPHCAWRF
jgi:hypothetical protein